jgi:hypothetical protein
LRSERRRIFCSSSSSSEVETWSCGSHSGLCCRLCVDRNQELRGETLIKFLKPYYKFEGDFRREWQEQKWEGQRVSSSASRLKTHFVAPLHHSTIEVGSWKIPIF